MQRGCGRNIDDWERIVAGVAVSWSSLQRAQRRDENGGLWVLLRTKAEPSVAMDALLAADAVATAAANAAEPDDPPLIVDVPVATPRGPVVFIVSSDTVEALRTWAEVVARELTAVGISGRLTATTPEWAPFQRDVEPPACVSAGVVLPMDMEQVAADRQRGLPLTRWYADQTSTRQVVDQAVRFIEQGRGPVYFGQASVQFRIDPDRADAMVAEVLATRGPVVTLLRADEEWIDRVVLAPLGRVLFQRRRPEVGLVEVAGQLSQVLADLAPVADYGLVRLGVVGIPGWDWVIGVGWQPLPWVRPSYHRLAPELEASRVPDVYGIQLLNQTHLATTADLSGWQVREVADGKHLVTAPDLDPWFSVDPEHLPRFTDGFSPNIEPCPPPAVLEPARADFGPLILRKDELDAFRRARDAAT